MVVTIETLDINNIEEANIALKTTSTQCYIDADNLGSGTLVIGKDAVRWIDESKSENNGFLLHYPQISLHAISRDSTNFPHACLYMMVQRTEYGDEEMEEGDSDDERESNLKEVRFVPGDEQLLENMYKAMCQCQLLHPDPEDSLSDGDLEYTGEEGGGDADGHGNDDDGFDEGSNGINFEPMEGQFDNADD